MYTYLLSVACAKEWIQVLYVTVSMFKDASADDTL